MGISANAKIVTPVYTTSLAAELEGDAPVFKVTFKSTATSVFVILDYDLDSAGLGVNGKAVLTHADLTMDIQHVLSDSRLTLNMDITSPTFTDVSFRYAASMDGITASVSTPSTGFLGLQFQGRVPSQLNGRLYGRYASAPEDDVEILIFRASAKDGDKMNLNVAFTVEAPETMVHGLKESFPAIVSTLNDFGEKYPLIGNVTGLKSAIVNLVEETYTTVNNQAPDLTQVSILFRNTVVQYQKIVQVFLDNAAKFPRETQFKLPGSDEMTTLPE